LAKKEDGFRLFNEFTKGVAQHATQGIEEIIGSKDFSWAVEINLLKIDFFD
jgi:hypothetical protein